MVLFVENTFFMKQKRKKCPLYPPNPQPIHMHTQLSFQLFTGSFCKDSDWGTKRPLLQKKVTQVKKISFLFFVKLSFLRHERGSVSFHFFCYFFPPSGASLLWRKSECPKGRLHWFSSIEHCFLSKYLSYLSQSLLEFLCLSFVLWFWSSP